LAIVAVHRLGQGMQLLSAGRVSHQRHDVRAETGRRQAVIGPPLHESAAKVENIRSEVGALGSTSNLREASLGKFARHAAVGAPVPKARPEAMHSGLHIAVQPAQTHQHGHVRDRPVLDVAGEGEAIRAAQRLHASGSPDRPTGRGCRPAVTRPGHHHYRQTPRRPGRVRSTAAPPSIARAAWVPCHAD